MFNYFDYEKLDLHAQKDYKTASPFPHQIIDNACESIIENVSHSFPKKDWFQYDNQLEKKFAQNLVHQMSYSMKCLLSELNSYQFINFLEKLTGIEGLVSDPHYRGAGAHEILRGGHLAIHADFNFHPKLKLYRRVNVIVYLNHNWKEEYGGHLELWDKDMSGPVVKILPTYNRLVVFNSTDTSYHGHPLPLECPDHITRRSIVAYYYTASPPPEGTSDPHSVRYKLKPGEEASEELLELMKQREKFRELK